MASLLDQDIRLGGPDRVCEKLVALAKGEIVCVNALCQRDLDVFVCGLLRAEDKGKTFLYRTAASFVASRGMFSCESKRGTSQLPKLELSIQ
jgi:hypothetical protein